MAAPTFIQEAESAFNVDTTPKNSGNFATQTGDIVVSCMVAESNNAGEDPVDSITATGTNVTLTVQERVNANDGLSTEALISTGSVASGGTTSVAFARTSFQTLWFGGNALTFRGSDGVGAAEQAISTGAPSLSITTTQDNSAIVVVVGDWVAADGASRTWRTVNSIAPTAGNGFELTYFRDAAHYAAYIAYYPDAGAAGAKTVGLSAPGGQTYSIAAVEIKGTTGGASPALDDSGSFPGFEAQSNPLVISVW